MFGMQLDWIEDEVLAASSIPIDLNDVRSLHDQGIRAIVTLTEHPLTIHKSITPDSLRALDITYLHAPIPDGYAPDIPLAQAIVGFIEQMSSERRPTFIHCHAGIGRTGTMLHCYFLSRGLSMDEAGEKVRTRRPACNLLNLSTSQRTFLEQFAAACQS
jgi:atypical dual specificity phosphatase